jgi:hypothetical protein
MDDKIKAASKLLDDFNSFVDNRSTVFLVILPEFFPKFLEWHFSIWEREYQLLGKKDRLHEWITYSELSRALDSILKKIEERTLKEGHSFSFFKSFESHIEKYKEKSIDGEGSKKFYYVESIMPIFFTALTENIKNSPENHDIWGHYFPSSWKITKENIKKQENYVSHVLLNNFLRWSQSRIWDSADKEKFDEVLDAAASNLFPSVEPILWAKLLTLLMRSRANNNRMKSLVEQGTNFGFVSRTMIGDYISAEQSSQELHKHMESQGNATIELALFLFPREFTKEKLNSFISELNELEYDKGSREETRRKELILIFEKMIGLLNSK